MARGNDTRLSLLVTASGLRVERKVLEMNGKQRQELGDRIAAAVEAAKVAAFLKGRGIALNSEVDRAETGAQSALWAVWERLYAEDLHEVFLHIAQPTDDE